MFIRDEMLRELWPERGFRGRQREFRPCDIENHWNGTSICEDPRIVS